MRNILTGIIKQEMSRSILIVSFICGFMTSSSQAAENTVVSPNLSVLQGRTENLVERRWKHWSTTSTNYKPTPSLKKVEIRMIRRADALLTNIPTHIGVTNPLEDKPVYLVHAVAWSDWWKATTEHVLVFHSKENDWKTLLHFNGGSNGRGIAFKTIDLGVSSAQEAILISDYASGNQMSQTHTHIYRYDKNDDHFVEIFSQLTTWLPSVKPIVYESSFSFEKSNSTLKNIVVLTQLVKQQPIETDFEMSHRSVFKWDGKKYIGKMNLPITSK